MSSLTQSEGEKGTISTQIRNMVFVKFRLDWTYVIGNITFLDYYFCRISLGLDQN